MSRARRLANHSTTSVNASGFSFGQTSAISGFGTQILPQASNPRTDTSDTDYDNDILNDDLSSNLSTDSPVQSSTTKNMDNGIKADSENTVTSQNPSAEKDEYKDCCGICLAAYKSPRILPCKHILCRLCLTELADKSQVEAAKESGHLICPLCREKIDLSSCPIDKLPMYFEDDEEDEDDDEAFDLFQEGTVKNDDNDDDEDKIGDKDVDDGNDEKVTDERVLCVVCEDSVPAEYECFQCQKVFCVSCKTNHDIWLKHEVQDLKLDLSQDHCLKHPDVKVRYICRDCGSTICKECVKSEHSLHQTQTIKSYLMEIDGQLKIYSTKIEEKLETVEMSKVLFSSNVESKVSENIENLKKLGEDFKIDLEKACGSENENQHKDKTLLNRIHFMGRRIKKSKGERKFNQNLISEIQDLMEKITTHEKFYLPHKVDDIINNQIGKMDVQMGRLFVFKLDYAGKAQLNFVFGNLNWTFSAVGLNPVYSATQPSISLTPFIKPEDTLLIESITSAVTIYIEGGAEDNTISRKFVKTFHSTKDQMKWELKGYDKTASCIKVLFQKTKIKQRTQVE